MLLCTNRNLHSECSLSHFPSLISCFDWRMMLLWCHLSIHSKEMETLVLTCLPWWMMKTWQMSIGTLWPHTWVLGKGIASNFFSPYSLLRHLFVYSLQRTGQKKMYGESYVYKIWQVIPVGIISMPMFYNSQYNLALYNYTSHNKPTYGVSNIGLFSNVLM